MDYQQYNDSAATYNSNDAYGEAFAREAREREAAEAAQAEAERERVRQERRARADAEFAGRTKPRTYGFFGGKRRSKKSKRSKKSRRTRRR